MQDAAPHAVVTASNAAAVAVTLRVLQLASSACGSGLALPSGLLQSINTANRQAAHEDLAVLTACMAEALACQDAAGCLVSPKLFSLLPHPPLRTLASPILLFMCIATIWFCTALYFFPHSQQGQHSHVKSCRVTVSLP